MTAVASEKTGTASAADEVARLRATFASGRTRDIWWRKRQLAGIE